MRLALAHRRLALALCAALALGAAGDAAAPREPNGFSLAGARVPPGEILAGGPPRDGIHSVDAPRFVPPEEATWVAPYNPVLGVAVDGEAHAYPVHLIEYHQIVNDELHGVPVVVTYDPLAGAPRAFRRDLGGRKLEFGVSGLIYNHNFLMYDRQTSSLWVQFNGLAVTGPLAGRRLTRLPIRREVLGAWLAREPRTVVLERPDPHHIDYRFSPFSSYIVQDKLIFPVHAVDRRFHLKEVVLGATVGDHHRAYLGSLMTAAGGAISDEMDGRTLRISYDSGEAVFSWDVPDDVQVDEAYWLAWKAFHPDTEVWHDPDPGSPGQ